MKYKVGNKVKIRSDLKEFESYGGYYFIPNMVAYRGEEAIITKVNSSSYFIDIDKVGWKWTDEMFESVEEMSAVEAIQIFGEFCVNTPCLDCAISKLDVEHTCQEIRKDFPKETLEVLKQWKTSHEKKPIETEFFNIVRVIEDVNGTKRCVYEERVKCDENFTGAQIRVLKEYCEKHNGRFFTVPERVCQVKE